MALIRSRPELICQIEGANAHHLALGSCPRCIIPPHHIFINLFLQICHGDGPLLQRKLRSPSLIFGRLHFPIVLQLSEISVKILTFVRLGALFGYQLWFVDHSLLAAELRIQ